MKIKIIDFGLPENHRPLRSHANDAGADVYMPFDCTLEPGGIAKIPLGFGMIGQETTGIGGFTNALRPRRQDGADRCPASALGGLSPNAAN